MKSKEGQLVESIVPLLVERNLNVLYTLVLSLSIPLHLYRRILNQFVFWIPVLPVIDSLAPKAELQGQGFLIIKSLDGTAKQVHKRKCGRKSVIFQLTQKMACFLLLINCKITCRYKQRNLSLHRCQLIFSINFII